MESVILHTLIKFTTFTASKAFMAFIDYYFYLFTFAFCLLS